MITGSTSILHEIAYSKSYCSSPSTNSGREQHASHIVRACREPFGLELRSSTPRMLRLEEVERLLGSPSPVGEGSLEE